VADLVLPAGVTTDADPEEPIVIAQLTSLALAEDEGEAEEGEEGEEGETAEGEGGESASEGDGGEG